MLKMTKIMLFDRAIKTRFRYLLEDRIITRFDTHPSVSLYIYRKYSKLKDTLYDTILCDVSLNP